MPGIFAFIGLFAVVSSAAVKSADLLPLVVYAEPGVDNDSLWMADAKDYLEAEGLADRFAQMGLPAPGPRDTTGVSL